MPGLLLILIGIVLAIAEIFVPSAFFILMFGVASIIVGLVTLFIPLNLSTQLLTVATLGLLTFAIFKKYFYNKIFSKESKTKDFKLKSSTGHGTYENGLVTFNGTNWEISPESHTIKNSLEDGETVKVIRIDSNKVIIERDETDKESNDKESND